MSSMVPTSAIGLSRQVFLRLVSPTIVAVVASVLAAAVIAAYSAELAAVTLALLVLGGLILPILIERAGRGPSRRVAEGAADLNVALVDMLDGLTELEAYGATSDVTARITAISDDTITQGEHLARLSGLGQAGIWLTANLALWLSLVLLIPGVASGERPGAEFVMLALLAWATFEAVAPIPQALHTLGGTLASAHRILAIADAPTPVPDPVSPARLPASRALRFEGVALQYPGRRRPALDGIDLLLAPGRHVGVLGPSG
jgi:ATP-binding cassette subfamily C protein CydC